MDRRKQNGSLDEHKMIYTLTLNPAVDYYITVNDLKIGDVNRTQTQKICFGGKGINVSLVLKELGVPSVAFGFVGGFTGTALENYLKQKGIKCDFIGVNGDTRINVKLNHTDINAAGPNITNDDIEKLYKKLENLKSNDFLILSGSVPKSLPQNIYQKIMGKLQKSKINFVVDAQNELLLNTLEYKPFLIKPNQSELSQIFNAPINDFDTALQYAEILQKRGAQNVMVTLGDMGAVLLDKNKKTHIQKAPKGCLVSAVGSGDSAIAAFLSQYLKGCDYGNCLKWAVAAGSVTAFSNGLATKEDIQKII